MTISEAIFKAGAKWRNPDLFEVATQLRKTDFASRDEYHAIQAEKLKNLFAFHKKHSAYYRDLLPENISEPHAVLASLPILTKADLLAHQNRMQCYAHCGRSFFAETSGSTGQPFSFRKDLVWDTYHRASILRSYSWYGIDAWQRNGYFWGYNFSSAKKMQMHVLDKLQNRFRVFSYDKTELTSFLEKLKSASYLHGYSSMIYEVAQIAQEIGFSPKDFPNLKMVKGTSEKIYDYYLEPVKRVFGLKMISEYGSAEGGIHAFECPMGNMHVNEENTILEEVNGEAVVTNLNAFSIPIYRYKIGDAITIGAKKQCDCGRNTNIVTEVLGRVGKVILGKTQKFPSLTLYYIFKNIAVSHGVEIPYQVLQKKVGELEFRIPRNLNFEERGWIESESAKYFKGDIEITIHENQNIFLKKGKHKDFITEL